DMSTAYHPQTDGQSERTIQTLEDKLRASLVLWAEIGESRLIGPELVQEMTDKVVLIKEKLKSARDRQKSYVDNRRKLLEFKVEDQVLLKVSPWKGVVRLEKRHVSIKKCLANANLHVHLEEIKVDKTFCFVEEPIEIINREVKNFKCCRIPIIKVHWNSKQGRNDFIKTRYPHLLVEQAIVRSTK
ncbi:putative reverse transcriptase domain-containing protein, partial [Tanacetum coccineum]